jgi:uncharacterized protein YdaU (DUF1376 family)
LSARPWYKRYPSDFIGGTLDLSFEEKGAYSILLDLMYDKGRGVIPDDSAWIARVLGCSTRKWNQLRERLIEAGKIEVRETGLTNHRVAKQVLSEEKEALLLAENARKARDKTEINRGASRDKNAENEAVSRENKDLTEKEHGRGVKPTTQHRARVPEARSQNPPKPPLDGETPNSSDAQKRDGWRSALETACGVDLSKLASPGDHRAFEAMVDAAIASGLSERFLTDQLAAARQAKGDQPRSPGPYWRKVLDRIIADETGAGGADDDAPVEDPVKAAAELRALRVKQFAESAAKVPDWPWDETRKGPRPSPAECEAAAAWDRTGRPPEIFFQTGAKAGAGR